MNAVLIPHRRRLTAEVSGAGAATAVTLQFPTGVGSDLANRAVLLHQFIQQHTAGSAANHQPRIGATGFAADSVDEKYLATSAAVADPINEAGLGVHLLLDADARATWMPGPDAGADNDFTCELWYEEVKLDA